MTQGYLVGPTANLWYSEFTHADFTGMDLSGTNFTYASLTDVTFLGASTTSINVTGVTWTNVICPSGQPAINGYNDGAPTSPAVGC